MSDDKQWAERIKAECGGIDSKIWRDTEADHAHADDILCDLLESLGYAETVAAFKAVDKRYA